MKRHTPEPFDNADEDAPYDAGDEEHVKKRKRDSTAFELRRIEGLRETMSTPSGRAFMWWLLGQTRFAMLSFTGNKPYTDFNEGARAVGLQLYVELEKHAWQQALQMRDEHNPHKPMEQ